MFIKIVIISYMMYLCAVKASVINIDVHYEDESYATHQVLSSKLTECNSEECNEFCRSVGFSSGTCFGDWCQCGGGVRQNAECNSEECDEQCRSMGFAGGSCFGDSCQCGGMIKKNTQKETPPQFYAMETCSPLACDQLCRTLSFPKGVCVDKNCKCDIKSTLLNTMTTHQSSSVEDCSPLDCDQICRRIGFPGGACVNGHCKCDILLSTSVVDTEGNQLDDCSPNACDQLCRRMGYTGGVCVGDRCKCDINMIPAFENKLNKGDNKISIRTVRDCNVVACNEMCHRLNYLGSMCTAAGSCECY